MKKGKKPTGKDLPPIDGRLVAQFLGLSPSKGEVARAKILAATLHCIATRGIEVTGFESVGQIAGMHRAHVAYYFPDREEMIFTAVQYAIATAQQTTVQWVLQAKSDPERLEAMVLGAFDWAEKYPDQVRVMVLAFYYASYQPRYQELVRDVREQGAERLCAVLKPLAPKQPTARLAEWAKTVQNLLTGDLLDRIITGKKLDPAPVLARIWEILTREHPSLRK